MNERLSRFSKLGGALIRRTWPQLLTMIAFMAAISLRFPLWFVVLSAIVSGAAVAYLVQCFASRPSGSTCDPLLGAVLIGSGLASIALTLKWWTVEQQSKLAPGALLHFAGHTEAPADSALAWSSVLTQWGSCLIFLVIVAVWAMSARRSP
ncbi:hypothetical protein [Paraburkholderia terrae]|uniref:HPP family protein n=1 Tax=Paraburkholderia terrae TaxID=311230 RepID=A0ABN6JW23_9BURK|nr:hypothetical protein [Paraburkholderia terrae]BCZ85030.1 hypothetical protein PTKU64_87050 [Paraburkholderia terrae]BDC44991.1 hypothetical protein PTKU15_82880 [Paraburkholderia terrae]